MADRKNGGKLPKVTVKSFFELAKKSLSTQALLKD
jgi:hypothetical protein